MESDAPYAPANPRNRFRTECVQVYTRPEQATKGPCQYRLPVHPHTFPTRPT